MARLIQVIDKFEHGAISLMPDGSVGALYTITAWHWELINTTPAEVAYFQSLGDNDDEHDGLHKETLVKPYPGVPEVW